MKKFSIGIGLLFLMFLLDFSKVVATESELETKPDDTEHNWEEYSTDYETFETGTHEYTYWKNFMKYSRTCHISHEIKTVVYYCDLHDHTRSETSVEETVHSGRHK